ncbi:MAG TPA: OmpW family outer membrane protein [Xanthobacteraceae bacterium]
MNHRISAFCILILGLSGMHARLANAQSSTQDAQIYAGYLFGDRLLKEPLSGSTPRLDDNGTYGARYTYHFTGQWAVQLSAGYSPNLAAHAASGATHLGLSTVDLDLEWDFLSDFRPANHRLIPYTVIGAGYAWANLDHPLSGFIGATPLFISDSNGYTANAGFGAKYFLTNSVFVDLDARYRYMSKLTDRFGQGLNTAETTLSVGYRF